MTGLKLARINTCVACSEFRNASAVHWTYPRCKACGVDSDGDAVRDLDAAFLEGPETNCPENYWVGLEPVDLDQLKFEQRQTAIANFRNPGWGVRLTRKPVLVRLLRPAIEQIGLPTVRSWLLEAINDHEVFLWLAVELTKDFAALNIGVPANAYYAVAQEGAARILGNVEWGGNDEAWYALRDCWESAALTGQEAQAIAAALNIVEPTS